MTCRGVADFENTWDRPEALGETRYAAIFIELKNAYLTLSDNPTRRQQGSSAWGTEERGGNSIGIGYVFKNWVGTHEKDLAELGNRYPFGWWVSDARGPTEPCFSYLF